jgi:hypothetical protein
VFKEGLLLSHFLTNVYHTSKLIEVLSIIMLCIFKNCLSLKILYNNEIFINYGIKIFRNSNLCRNSLIYTPIEN